MPIVLYTDFDGDLLLPSTASTTPEGELLAKFISQYEAEYLTDLLGYELAKDLQATLPPTDPDLLKLYSGQEYTDKHGYPNKWPGFRNSVYLLSIACFIYCKWLKFVQTQSTTMGERGAKTENAFTADATHKHAAAWNKMVRLNCILHDFITQNLSDYPDYPGITSRNAYLYREITAFGF